MADINSKYEDILNGRKTPSQTELLQMYEQYLIEFKQQVELLAMDPVKVDTWHKNINEIIEHNSNSENSWKKGINSFTDMTFEEFASFYIMAPQADCSATEGSSKALFEIEEQDLDMPAGWDWRDHKGVTPVKNQGHCGSCWTFSTVGTLEAHIMIKYGEFRNISEQQLVDCAQAFDNHGCNGGLPSHAFNYIMYNGGITDESHYPYTAKDGACGYFPNNKTAEVDGGPINITRGDEDELKAAVYMHGPVSVAFQVIKGFKEYHSGVYQSDECGTLPTQVNHAVVAVGYGVENDVPYWIVKNSWSATWGDQGYFKIARGVNMCGIAQCNSYPYGVWITPKKPVE